MDSVISTLTLAVSVISMLIALGQLMIAVPSAQPTKRKAITSCARIRRPSRFLMVLLILNSLGGAVVYWFVVDEPAKLDIYMLAVALASGAMGYSTALVRYLVRHE